MDPGSGSGLASRIATTYPNISRAALTNLSQALDVIRSEAELALTFEETYLRDSIINVALTTLFFGFFTVLAAVAAHVLFSKGIKRTATANMLIAIILMWMSTAAYWIGTLVAAAEVYTVLRNLTSRSVGRTTTMQDCLYPWAAGFTDTASIECGQDLVMVDLYNIKAYTAHDCIDTAALVVNVVIGDSIVWWRAWVLWPDSRAVRLACAIMILLTTVAGIMDTTGACKVFQEVVYDGTIVYVRASTRGIWFGGNVWGYAAVILSLLTNIIATTLIAYRAWEHRRIIMFYLKGSSSRTQVERTLALLIESGVLYCGLWIVISVYGLSYAFPSSTTTKYVKFMNGLYFVMEGCIVPLIGMYPTLIIIVCAVDKSLHEKPSDDHRPGNASIVFAAEPRSRYRGTLSELISASSAHSTQEGT